MRIRHSGRRTSNKTFGQLQVGEVFSWVNAGNAEQRYIKTGYRESFSVISNNSYKPDRLDSPVIRYDAELVLTEIVE